MRRRRRGTGGTHGLLASLPLPLRRGTAGWRAERIDGEIAERRGVSQPIGVEADAARRWPARHGTRRHTGR